FAEIGDTFFVRLALTIGAGHLCTICDIPRAVLFDNCRELVAHGSILAPPQCGADSLKRGRTACPFLSLPTESAFCADGTCASWRRCRPTIACAARAGGAALWEAAAVPEFLRWPSAGPARWAAVRRSLPLRSVPPVPAPEAAPADGTPPRGIRSG